MNMITYSCLKLSANLANICLYEAKGVYFNKKSLQICHNEPMLDLNQDDDSAII